MRGMQDRLDEYREQGYTIFSQLFDAATLHRWRDAFPDLAARSTPPGGSPPIWLRNCIELSPNLFLHAVAHPELLDFAEAVMGPFVQLDNLTFVAFPSVSHDEARGKVSGWHRDIWAEVPRTTDYTRPLACNAICYLQDMTPEYGPLRVIPGSHRRPTLIAGDARQRPHPDEICVPVKAGDVVFTHNGLLHSGTPNTTGKPRFFFSIYYNLVWLKHRDNHSGFCTQQIVESARKRNDRRLMRLFGVDDCFIHRANSGFCVPDEEQWQKWSDEDRAVLRQE